MTSHEYRSYRSHISHGYSTLQTSSLIDDLAVTDHEEARRRLVTGIFFGQGARIMNIGPFSLSVEVIVFFISVLIALVVGKRLGKAGQNADTQVFNATLFG